MKKQFLVVLSALLLLCACQPTPEQEIVLQKDQDVMIDKAKDEIPQEEKDLTQKERLGVPDRYRYTYQKGFVSVEADAEVLVPDGEIPIIRVFPADFDQTTASRLWDTLVGDMPMYQYSDTITKDAIKRQMEYLIRIIDGDVPKEEAMETAEEAQAELLTLQEQYANAPDSASFVPVDATLKTAFIGTERNPRMAKHTYVDGMSMETGWTFSLVNNLDNRETIVLQENDGKRITPVIRNAYANYSNKNAAENACYRIIGKYGAEDVLPDEIGRSFPVTPQEAISETQRMLQSTGLNDRFSVSELFLIDGMLDNEPVYAYRVICTRSVRGVPCLSAVGVPDASSANDVYRPIWKYEQMVITVGRNGVCSFSWNSPYAGSDAVAEQAKLLPFSDISAIAEKMLPIMLAAQADGEATDQTRYVHRIDRVQLGLWRICEYNDIEKGLLTPVWGFYSLTEETGRFGETAVQYAPILLINAVDGSIIDPMQGY